MRAALLRETPEGRFRSEKLALSFVGHDTDKG